jgi:hypothetical protein
MINKDDILIISCFFGNKKANVYEAPLNKNCYFFSNNTYMREEVENKKWVFVMVDQFDVSEDYVVSSCQSKYIKFLKFMDDYLEFDKYNYVLYFDQKVYIKEEHIDKLIETINNDSTPFNIFIRKHEAKRNTIMSEVDAALGQERYKRNMDKTVDLINNKINNGEIRNEIDICNTGLIFYINYSQVKEMLDDIYYTCMLQQQPECQIIWAIYSQKYLDKIKLIDFYNVVDPVWREPFYTQSTEYESTFYFSGVLIILFILILCIFLIKTIKSLKAFSYIKGVKKV